MTRFGDGKTPWQRFLVLTSVLGGVLVPFGSLVADVAISELLYHPQNALLEFIELHNTGDAPVSLEGWSFTDGIVYRFPPGSEIAANGWLVVCAYRSEVAAAYGIPVDQLFGDYEGALSNGGERVALSDAQGRVVDAVEFSDSPPFDPAADGFGPSLERLCFEAAPDTPGNWRASSSPGGTPLEPNSQVACPPPLPPAFSGVVIHEIYYHPPGNADPDEEFVELHNVTDSLVDLEGLVVAGGIDYVFDRAVGPVQIPAGGFLLVAKDPARLSQITGIAAASIAGPYVGRLSNFRDEIRLELPDGATLDRVEYSQDGLWPAHADGLGSSLQLINPHVSSALPQNWTVAADDRCAQGQNCVFVTNGTTIRWYENLDGTDPGFVG